MLERPPGLPTSRRLAYESSAGSVTIARVDGSGPIQVPASNPEFDHGPVWSPDGSKIAFQATWDARSWIYTVRADGTRKRRLAPGNDPAWSANGQQLALINNCTLFTVNSNGRHIRRLSRKGEFVTGAAWSPNNPMLAYVSGKQAEGCPGATYRLRVQTVRADGTRARLLGHEPSRSLVWGNPVWTPDGKQVLVAIDLTDSQRAPAASRRSRRSRPHCLARRQRDSCVIRMRSGARFRDPPS